MRRLLVHTRMILLSAAAVWLGYWSLLDVESSERAATSPAQATPGQLLDGDAGEAVVAVGSQLPATASAPTAEAVTGGPPGAAGTGSFAGPALGDTTGSGNPQVDAGYERLLDRVFGPGRTTAPERRDDPRMNGRGRPAPDGVDNALAIQATTSAAESADVAARRRDGPLPVTEKEYYERFLALAESDAMALPDRAQLVLHSEAEVSEKVALLRALYDTDRSAALDHFLSAIVSLPDRPRPEGVSVPHFAVGFLAQRVDDPAVKPMVERIAWTDYPTVSPQLRQIATDALYEAATEADLRRYAHYPGHEQNLARANAAEDER